MIAALISNRTGNLRIMPSGIGALCTYLADGAPAAWFELPCRGAVRRGTLPVGQQSWSLPVGIPWRWGARDRAGPICRSLSATRRGNSGREGAAKRDPRRSCAGFALQVDVAALPPRQNGVALVVENEVPSVGSHHQDRMRFAVPVDDRCHAQHAPGETGRNEALTLDELIILAVAIAVLGEAPMILHA